MIAKALVLHGNEDLRYEEYEVKKPIGNEVKVKIKAVGICGSDIPRVLYNGAHNYPIILGHEFSGYVEEIGESVVGLKIGDRVAGVPLKPCMKCLDCKNGNYSLCKNYSFIGSREQGAFCDYLTLDAQNLVKFDDKISFEQGAFFEPSTVALHGVKLSKFKNGGDVVILGGGTIGLFTMQWAKIYGASSVTVFDISDERLALAKKLGADRVINTSSESIDKFLNTFDCAFETAGQIPTMKTAYKVVKNRANICFIGTPHEPITFTQAEWEILNRKELTLTGSWMSYSHPFPGGEWTETADKFLTGELKFDSSLIFKKIDMSEGAKAFQLFKNPKDVKGKIILINKE